ncbi:AT-rich interactive domain-containing protein 3 [Sesamum angolense]|uniref:AT-rich interactive domain-containing protein 3 n=1 Tax=Sesamum angolense TaxID=2727404 RepID=A0AAE1WXF5_9LAMI|nr:AT-rich interactive domain-containing protein 3 [Sesamum angolense]
MAENGFRKEELENEPMPIGDVQKEEELERKVKEIEIVANDRKEGPAVFTESEVEPAHEIEELKNEADIRTPSKSFLLDANDGTGDESGTEEEQAAFMKELETFHRERCLDFKPPKFYQEPLNCLKLWRAVIRLGGYEQDLYYCFLDISGFYEKALLEYEKYKMRSGELPFTDASISDPASGNQVDLIHASGSGRARRDAAARAMQGWHSQRLLSNGEVGDPIIKDKNQMTTPKREKQLRNIGFLKRKGSSPGEHAIKVARVASKSQFLTTACGKWTFDMMIGNFIVFEEFMLLMAHHGTRRKPSAIFRKCCWGFVMAVAVAVGWRWALSWLCHLLLSAPLQALEIMVVDVGVPADWVKVNVQRMKDCYEVYALVPGLLREEIRLGHIIAAFMRAMDEGGQGIHCHKTFKVRVQSDPAGRLVISGQPEQQDNPWGVTPFKKVVSLPTRIDPHQTSAVVTLHGQLFVRVPFEQSDI